MRRRFVTLATVGGAFLGCGGFAAGTYLERRRIGGLLPVSTFDDCVIYAGDKVGCFDIHLEHPYNSLTFLF